MYKIKQNVNFGFNLLISFPLSGILLVVALSQAQAELSAGDSLSNDSGLLPVDCGEGFVGVPGNTNNGTQDVCVMKYEAKQDPTDPTRAISQASGRPWVNINRAEAQAACEASGLKLLTNAHWQTIAHNIELVPKNWANGKIGDAGGLNRGHSDGVPSSALEASTNDTEGCFGTGQEATCNGAGRSQKRTHTLSNRGKDEVIWDFAGNVWEWVSDHNSIDYGLHIWTPISVLAGEAKTIFSPSGDYSTTLGPPSYGNLGVFFPGTGGGVLRGGRWASHGDAGVFAAALSLGPSYRATGFGFRCFYSP